MVKTVILSTTEMMHLRIAALSLDTIVNRDKSTEMTEQQGFLALLRNYVNLREATTPRVDTPVVMQVKYDGSTVRIEEGLANSYVVTTDFDEAATPALRQR